MKSALPSGAPAPSFDDPLGMLSACHRRIERQFATLARLQRHLPERGCDDDARAAARAILKYFDDAAPNHHADEEQSLFPRLAALRPPVAPDLVAALLAEHATLAERWNRLRPLLSGIADGAGAVLPPADVEAITAAYASHIAREDGELIPLARAKLDAGGACRDRPRNGGSPRRVLRPGREGMTLWLLRSLRLVAAAVALLALATGVRAQQPSPYAIDVPPWFTETFLDFRDDVADAAKNGRRLMIYFGQDGCPYCRQLMVTNFSQRPDRRQDAAALRPDRAQHLGRPRNDLDRRTRHEREGARARARRPVHADAAVPRREGCCRRSPQRLLAAASLRGGARLRRRPAGEAARRSPPILRARPRSRRNATLADESVLRRGRPTTSRASPAASRSRSSSRRPYCSACDELHRDAMRRPDVQAQLARFDVARFELGVRTELTAPGGGRVRADAWARDLGVAYAPTIVFFDAGGREVFRIDAYLRAVPHRLGPRLRRERRVPQRTVVPALRPGARRAAARRRRLGRSPGIGAVGQSRGRDRRALAARTSRG